MCKQPVSFLAAGDKISLSCFINRFIHLFIYLFEYQINLRSWED